MNRSKITLAILLVLTVIAAIISNDLGVYAAVAILVLAGLKFIGISFFFMELNKAHPFWKSITIIFLLIFISIIGILLK